jgi:hypothetical protein
MREVSDFFLLNMAEVTAAFTGLFLIGVFFFVETGMLRRHDSSEVLEPYFRSGTRIVLILFAIPLSLSLTLVAMEAVWSHLLFAALSLLLVAANVDSARRVRGVSQATGARALLFNEVVGTVVVALIVTLPWVLGGIDPSREDLTWSILLAFAAGFLSVSALVLSAYDIARPKPRG